MIKNVQKVSECKNSRQRSRTWGVWFSGDLGISRLALVKESEDRAEAISGMYRDPQPGATSQKAQGDQNYANLLKSKCYGYKCVTYAKTNMDKKQVLCFWIISQSKFWLFFPEYVLIAEFVNCMSSVLIFIKILCFLFSLLNYLSFYFL